MFKEKCIDEVKKFKQICPKEMLDHKTIGLIFHETIEALYKPFVGKYLEKNGMPKTINDLSKHKFISFGKGAPSPVYNPDWALKIGMKDNNKRKSLMKVNSVMGLLLAVESGVGLAALPDYLVFQSRNLIKVLPKVEGPITEAHFVYPQSMKNVARVQAFKNFLYSKISEWEF